MEDIERLLFEHYKETYYREFKRKDSLNSSINIPLTIITLLVGVLAFFINNLPNNILSLSVIFFYIFLLGFMFFLIFSVYFFIRSIFNHTYGYIPNSVSIDKYYNELSRYNSRVKELNKIEIDNEINNLLKEQYCKFSKFNYESNNKKSGYIHHTTLFLILGIIFSSCCGIFYFVNKYNQPVEAFKVEIINTKGGSMLDDDKTNNSNNSNATNNQQTQNNEPQIPQRPQGDFIKEGDESKTIKK